MAPQTDDQADKEGPIEHQETQPESFNSDDDNNNANDGGDADDDGRPITYTDEELDAIRQVRTKLIEEYGIEESRIGLKFLAVATINCKLRVEETCKKMIKLFEIMETLDCPDGIDDELWKPEAAHELKPYAPVGRDYQGASIIWIQGGGKVPKEEERNHCHASIMHFMAIHADMISLKQGVTFVIDVSKSPEGPKIGNEKRLQNFYQAFPQRPQSILIAGTNRLTRIIVNASIKLASLFTKQKVLDRIEFVTVEDAASRVPLSSAPKYVGGQGGGIDNLEDWVKDRLENFPMPEL